ncbi:MAG TPA: twin-arginine translocase TatA/TatE family subunit [Candidatus Limnocylindrales bacterium]|jgi:TatA/E family protein of Tat protein translocase
MPFPNIGAPELIIILIIALIVLGPGKLPDVAASLGKSVREFRKAATDVSEAVKLDAPAPTPVAPTPVAPTPVAPTAVAPAATPGSPAGTEPGSVNTLSGASEPNTLKADDPKLS